MAVEGVRFHNFRTHCMTRKAVERMRVIAGRLAAFENDPSITFAKEFFSESELAILHQPATAAYHLADLETFCREHKCISGHSFLEVALDVQLQRRRSIRRYERQHNLERYFMFDDAATHLIEQIVRTGDRRV